MTKFEILDLALRAAGTPLGATQLGGTGKEAKALREALCAAGHLDIKSSKFTLTDSGKDAWRKQASPQQVEELEEQEARVRDEQLAVFIVAVRDKAGKKFTAKQLAPFAEDLRARAVESGYVQVAGNALAFEVLPAGEAFLRTRLVDTFRQSHRAAMAELRSLRTEVENEIAGLGEDGTALGAVGTALRDEQADAEQRFEQLLTELVGLNRVVAAARQFRDGVERRNAAVTHQAGEAHGKGDDLRDRLLALADEKRTELQTLGDRIAEKLSHLAARTDDGVAPTPSPAASRPTSAPTISGQEAQPSPQPDKTPAKSQPVTAVDLRAALKKAYDHLCLFVEFRDKLVELPRLYHETKKLIPTLTVEQYHRELDALSREWKIELHVLNEVVTAKEPELAIWENDRLRYYAFWK